MSWLSCRQNCCTCSGLVEGGGFLVTGGLLAVGSRLRCYEEAALLDAMVGHESSGCVGLPAWAVVKGCVHWQLCPQRVIRACVVWSWLVSSP